ncbi:MAG: DUF2061 domain-containing protein [Rhodospirillales bacterium]
MRLALKTVTYGCVHVAVATGVAYALTGNAAAAIGIGLIEPLVQTGVYAIHERLWEGGREKLSKAGDTLSARLSTTVRPRAAC